MNKTEFYKKAAIAFASNCSIAKENFNSEYCVNIICDLATKLTNKVFCDLEKNQITD